MAGLQHPDHVARADRSASGDRRGDRFVGGAQTPRVLDGHHAAPSQIGGEDDDSRSRRTDL